jgi:LytS/YehU family sensor histidine kinase
MTLAIDARSRAHERALESERFRTQLAETRLEALTAQLQPHFLFNTLQGISTLIRHDPDGADAMLASLSDLLREVLRRDGRREVELAEELRVLDSYLDISRRRFGNRLAISVDVDRSAAPALVPFFILQPLVENAIHHGVSSHAGTCSVSIRASREGERLALSVEDDGPGTAIADSGRGIGLANTEARLEQMYGDGQSLAFGRRTEGGFRGTATIPYRTAP